MEATASTATTRPPMAQVVQVNEELLEYATIYIAEFGWHLFPLWGCTDGLCDCGTSNCNKPREDGRLGNSRGKHPMGALAPRGRDDATTDMDQVEAWLREYPNMNLAASTGHESGIVVFDVDWDKGGDLAFRDMLVRFVPEPRSDNPMWSAAVATGGGGMHIYYQHPGEKVRNTSKKFGKGIDLRGDGGSATVPPSTHWSGKSYEWMTRAGVYRPLEPMPAWMKIRAQAEEVRYDLLPRSTGHRAYSGTRGPITEPGRNNELARIAGGIWSGGASYEELRSEIHHINRTSCIPPLQQEEVDMIARSITRYKRA